jgi:hypothetical protein
MKATILHDEHGKIIAISKSVNLKQAGSKFTHVGMIPGPGQAKVEIELDEEQERKPVPELHKEYRIDRATSRLVKNEYNF